MILLVIIYGGGKANCEGELVDFFRDDCYGRDVLSREKGVKGNIGYTD